MKKRTGTIHALGSKLVLVLLLLGGVFAAPTGVAAETPNIVFIVADDLGYGSPNPCWQSRGRCAIFDISCSVTFYFPRVFCAETAASLLAKPPGVPLLPLSHAAATSTTPSPLFSFG